MMNSDAKYLLLDTSGLALRLALADSKQLTQEIHVYQENIHSRMLAPLVQQILSTHDLQVGDLAAIGVNIGPGSFTGLRIGMAVIKGMVFGLDLPIVGIPGSDILAQAYFASGPDQKKATVLLDARRNEFFVTHFEFKNGIARSEQSAVVMTMATLTEKIPSDAVILTHYLTAKQYEMLDRVDSLRRIEVPFRFTAMQQMLNARLASGNWPGYENLEPLYVRAFAGVL
jgi:tRNA threonylcarbamoyl adenosine modification protein YeaZ